MASCTCCPWPARCPGSRPDATGTRRGHTGRRRKFPKVPEQLPVHRTRERRIRWAVLLPGSLLQPDNRTVHLGGSSSVPGWAGSEPVRIRRGSTRSLVDPLGLDPGSGCGFLLFGCIADLFSDKWASVAQVGLSTLQGIGECFLYMFTCVHSLEVATPLLLVGAGVTLIAGGVAACLGFGPPGCATIGSVTILAGGLTIWAGFKAAGRVWRKGDELFKFPGL